MGWFMGKMQGRIEVTRELLEVYKHLLDYGRPSKPIASVTERPATVEEIAEIRIGAEARTNLTDHLAQEAGVSTERAALEADKMLGQFESWGQGAGA